MGRRVVLTATVAVLVTIAAGVFAFFARVGAVDDAVAQQRRTARVLLDARAPLDESTARSLMRPGLHVVVQNDRDGILIDAAGSDMVRHPLPDAFGADPLPGGPPPPGGRPVHGPFAAAASTIAATFVHLRPQWVSGADGSIGIAPDGEQLGTWAMADALATFVTIALIAILSIGRASALARLERRTLRENMEERRAAAERYQQVLAETAHELRTPLTIVSGYVDILRSGGSAPRFDARIIEGLHAETGRMRALVAKMLTLARLDSPAGVARLLDVAAAAETTAETIRRRYPDRSITVVASGSPHIVIDGDDFADALGNLIENAVRYAPDSEIAVSASSHAGTAVVTVSDRGPGIAPEDRERIFERFYRGRGHDGKDGLGLGLAIVRGVAGRWGGTASVESVLGRTVFRLAFPVAVEEAQALAG